MGIPWECCREGLDFQDARGLAVAALHPGWEDQDLGLPLLHVLGKNSGVTGDTVWLVEKPSDLLPLESPKPTFPTVCFHFG